jgi:hypothetical protein
MNFVSRADNPLMAPFGDDHIAHLLRLKRYEQPPPGYFENFLHEFRRRQRDALRHQPLWSVCLDRMQDLLTQHNVRPFAYYSAAAAVAVACAAVISITVHQQPEPVQVAVESSPIPSTPPANAAREFNLAPLAMPRTFNAEPVLLPGTRDVRVLPIDSLRSDKFVPLRLEWESLEDQN